MSKRFLTVPSVWVKLQRFEELLCATAAAVEAVVSGEAMEVESNADRPSAALCHDLLAFEQDFLWKDGTVYRELMAAMSGGRRAFSREYVHRLHSSIVHEKGIASMCFAGLDFIIVMAFWTCD